MTDDQDKPRGPEGGAGPSFWDRLVLPHRRSHIVEWIVATAVLILASLPVRPNRVSNAEEDIFESINGLPGGLLDLFMSTVMQAGNLVVVPVVTFVALALRRVRFALDLFVAGISAWLLARIIKEVMERGRPADLLADVTLRGEATSGLGFVSGHTAVAFALATIANSYLGRTGRIVVWTVATLVGFARMYVGAHLPLDVLGGAALGWAVGSLVHALLGTNRGITLESDRSDPSWSL
ncbi:MAG: phosphatase PAP2 family protein [Actinomycetota bacterium]